MHRKVAGTLIVLALALTGIAGCGGGDEPLTRAEFVKQANAACTVKVPQSTTARSRGPEGFLTQVLAQQKAVSDGFDDLDAPDEVESDFSTLKTAMEQRVDLVEKALAAVKEDSKTTLDRFGKEAEGIQKRITSSSRALGLKSCT